jgi:nucleotide-binding universal stress UspA family protein
MKPIVLATDGSPSAAEATLRAVELARLLGAPVVAIAVEHVSMPAYGYYGYGEIVGELGRIENERIDVTLEQAAAVAAEHGVTCEVVHGNGPVVEQICSLARRRGAQMIVVGAHGWGPVRRVIHGSVSTAVLHDAPCPVLVVQGATEPVSEPLSLAETVATR